MAGYVLGERSAARASVAAQSLAGNRADRTIEEMLNLNDRIDRLLLVVEAMWSLMREQRYSDSQLRELIEQLDGGDGIVDGRRSVKPQRCPGCDSMVEPGRPTCAICGHDMPTEVPTFGTRI